jgi:hypothetical protein
MRRASLDAGVLHNAPGSWLKDSRVLTTIGLAATAGFGAGLLIFGQPWHLPPNYGDVPTWLAVLFAAIAGWIGLSQLGMLREQIAEEAKRNEKRDKLLDRQLEEAEARSVAARRSQAEGIKVRLAWDSSNCRVWISNDSPRPVTDVACLLVQKGIKTVVHTPDMSGVALRLGNRLVDPPYVPGTASDPRVRALAPEQSAVFHFDSPNRSEDEIFAVWFTDDAGFRWQLDEFQHLAPTHGDQYKP